MEYGISGYRNSTATYPRRYVMELDYVEADLSGDGSLSRVYLLGMSRSKHSEVIDEMALIIETDERKYYNIAARGSVGGRLQVCDLNGDGCAEVAVYFFDRDERELESNGFLKYCLYFNRDGDYQLGLTSDELADKMQFEVAYEPGQEVKVTTQSKAAVIINNVNQPKAQFKGVSTSIEQVERAISGNELVFFQGLVETVSKKRLGSIETKVQFEGNHYSMTHTILI